MKIDSVKLVCFSPTGTSKTVVQVIGNGIGHRNNSVPMELIDITKPGAREKSLHTLENELLVIAVPVYMGRVPAVINEWLNSICAHNTPVVCVVVYGNREYEDALLELKNIVMNRGCLPVACAAYIGEHSFSNPETPVAQGRPHEDDLNHAKLFGQKIGEKLDAVPEVSHLSDVLVPGTYPYGGVTQLWRVDFIEVDTLCTQCGVCAEICPVGAVNTQDSAMIDQEKCITCCACIKGCPQSARTMKPGPVKDASIRLYTLYREPKKPDLF